MHFFLILLGKFGPTLHNFIVVSFIINIKYTYFFVMNKYINIERNLHFVLTKSHDFLSK